MDSLSLQSEILKRADKIRRRIDCALPAKGRSYVSVDDVFQDVCTTAFQQAQVFHPQSVDSIETWIMALVNGSVVDSIRRQRALKRGGNAVLIHCGGETMSYLELFRRITGRRDTPSSEVAVREAEVSVKACVSKLPRDQRLAVELRYLQSRSWEETAATMQKTVPAIRGLLNRAMANMRTRMGRASRFFSDATCTSEEESKVD